MPISRVLGALACSLVLASGAFGADPKVDLRGPNVWFKDWPLYLRFGPETVSDKPVRVLLSKGPEDPAGLHFVVTMGKGGTVPIQVQTIPGALGTYEFVAVAQGSSEGDELPDLAISTLKVEIMDFQNLIVPPKPPTPIPPTPIPPTPIPTPDPPTPEPEPDGPVRVLMLYESSAPMTRAQGLLWNSAWLITYLDEATADDSQGEDGWRKWDKDVPIVNQSPEWAQMWAASKSLLEKPGAPAMPAIVVFKGTQGKAYAFPESEAALMSLVKGG